MDAFLTVLLEYLDLSKKLFCLIDTIVGINVSYYYNYCTVQLCVITSASVGAAKVL